eukprot:9589650-Lingulodinium_polyedra.AAC.1
MLENGFHQVWLAALADAEGHPRWRGRRARDRRPHVGGPGPEGGVGPALLAESSRVGPGGDGSGRHG